MKDEQDGLQVAVYYGCTEDYDVFSFRSLILNNPDFIEEWRQLLLKGHVEMGGGASGRFFYHLVP